MTSLVPGLLAVYSCSGIYGHLIGWIYEAHIRILRYVPY